MTKLVGITGGIGTGKSTVCKVFAILGIPIYEADATAKRLMQENEQVREGIIALFGEESFFQEKKENFNENSKISYQINRKYLAQKVFSSQENTQKMNEIVHPAVRLDYQNWVQENQHFPYLLNETALLFESGRFKDLDKVITISSPLALRIKRIKMRDNRSEEEINQIMQKQISEEEKIKRSDFVIYNDEKQLLLPQILKIHTNIIQNS